ncbi:MAG: restriction endonuclease subunit S [Candidatus Paceibacteria bacterium]
MSKLLEQINSSKKELVKLSDVAVVVPGFAFKSKDFSDDGIALVKITEIQSPYVVLDRCSRVDTTKYDSKKLGKYFLNEGEFVIAMTGATIGKVGKVITNEPLLLNQRVAVVRPKPDFSRKFIESKLTSSSFQSYINSIASGSSAQANISGDDIGDFKFMLPDLPVQNKIAEILNAYDAKIENNNFIIKKLEATAQNLFNEWFTNFRFLGYEKVEFVDSEMGQIPEKWEVKKIDDFCKTFGGGTPSTKESSYWENANIPWATPTDMTALSSIFINSTAKKISQNGLNNSSTKLLPSNSILMTSRATVGNLAISKIPITMNQGFIACVCDTVSETSFLFWWLKSNVSLVKGLATGSTFPEISRGVFRNIPIVVPDENTLSLFEKRVSSIHEHIYILYKENISLGSQRNQLLTKLI